MTKEFCAFVFQIKFWSYTYCRNFSWQKFFKFTKNLHFLFQKNTIRVFLDFVFMIIKIID